MKITIETNEDTGKRVIDVDGVLTSREQVGGLISLLQTIGYQVFPWVASENDLPAVQPPAPPPTSMSLDDREPF